MSKVLQVCLLFLFLQPLYSLLGLERTVTGFSVHQATSKAPDIGSTLIATNSHQSGSKLNALGTLNHQMGYRPKANGTRVYPTTFQSFSPSSNTSSRPLYPPVFSFSTLPSSSPAVRALALSSSLPISSSSLLSSPHSSALSSYPSSHSAPSASLLSSSPQSLALSSSSHNSPLPSAPFLSSSPNSPLFSSPLSSPASYTSLLVALVRKELSDCALVVAAHPSYDIEALVKSLAKFVTTLQVVEVESGVEGEDMGGRVQWGGVKRCTGYLLLLRQAAPLLALAATPSNNWDYNGRYVVLGLSLAELGELTRTFKGRKTQHILGLWQSDDREVWDLYMNQLYWGVGMARVATWRRGGFTSGATFIPDKTSDLRGTRLNVVTFEWKPSTLYYRTSNGTVAFLYGRDVEVVRTVAGVLNFTVSFTEPPNGERWGTVNKDGQWGGIVGTLARGKAELAIANLVVSSNFGRDKYLGYTAIFDTEDICFMARTEPPSPRWQSPLLPYTVVTWGALLMVLLLLPIVVYGLTTAAKRSSSNAKEPASMQYLGESFLLCMSLHLKEPHPAQPASHATRVLLATALIYTLVIYVGYSSNLTAFLTVTRRPQGISTITELHQSPLLLYEAAFFMRDALKTSPSPVLRSLATRHALVANVEESAPLVTAGKGVLITNKSGLDFVFNTVVLRGERGVRIMKECLYTYTVAMGVPSHSPLKARLDKAVTRVFEAGLVKFWRQDSYAIYKKNLEDQASTEDVAIRAAVRGDNLSTADEGPLVPLSLEHLQGVFYVCLCVYGIAILVFCGECLV